MVIGLHGAGADHTPGDIGEGLDVMERLGGVEAREILMGNRVDANARVS